MKRLDEFQAFNALPNEDISYGDLTQQIVRRIRLWPGLAPHETEAERGRFVCGEPHPTWRRFEVSCPELVLFRPTTTTDHDSLVIYMPGGGYNYQNVRAFHHNAKPILDSGRWVALLYYRAPRRANQKIYEAPREDAARAIRILRYLADELGYSPEKIGAYGFSAGAHLSAISAVSSMDKLYEPIDKIDNLPCHLNFAIQVYPAYVATDGATERNTNRGDGADILPEFKFDEKTPPMFMIHGDDDVHSSMASVLLYRELHKRRIKAQLFIFSDAGHGLNDRINCLNWHLRVIDWIESIGY